MLLATVLALLAAALHASWNLIVKRSTDRQLALWGQFTIGGALSAVVLAIWALSTSMPDIAWKWAIISGATHVPYLMLLSRAYDRGDFSLSYPIVRGAGALAATAGGVLFLNDTLTFPSAVGILIAVVGLFVLAKSGSPHVIGAALAVASTIAIYSVVDGHGTRQSQPVAYALALNIAAAIFVSLFTAMSNRNDDSSTSSALENYGCGRSFFDCCLRLCHDCLSACTGWLCCLAARVERCNRGLRGLENARRGRPQKENCLCDNRAGRACCVSRWQLATRNK